MMKLKNLFLVIIALGVLGLAIAKNDTVVEYITQFKEHRQVLAKKAAYKKQYREIDWAYDDGSRLKMRIPRKYITKIYERTEKKPYEWIIMRASYPEFQTGYEARNAAIPKMLRIELIEKIIDSLLSSKNARRFAENDVFRKRAYLYPNNFKMDHYKSISCLENYPQISEEFKRHSEPFRDELTPSDCWIASGQETFIPKTNTYSIRYRCTPLTERPNGWGGCSVFTHYRGLKLEYVMRRYMIPEWKAVHEAVLAFLDQFNITEPENITTED